MGVLVRDVNELHGDVRVLPLELGQEGLEGLDLVDEALGGEPQGLGLSGGARGDGHGRHERHSGQHPLAEPGGSP
ncbi:hypothetical protein D3C72_2211660 [compost metagenome]